MFVDGASRGNPGHAGVGVYAYTDDAAQPLFEAGCYLGKATNNVAEYAALALALYKATQIKGLKNLSLFADSELLVKQVKGLYRVRHPLLQKWHRLVCLLGQDIAFSIAHVRREKNQEADRLANAGIDDRGQLPDGFKALMKQYITSSTLLPH